jgi:hypothetical protein
VKAAAGQPPATALLFSNGRSSSRRRGDAARPLKRSLDSRATPSCTSGEERCSSTLLRGESERVSVAMRRKCCGYARAHRRATHDIACQFGALNPESIGGAICVATYRSGIESNASSWPAFRRNLMSQGTERAFTRLFPTLVDECAHSSAPSTPRSPRAGAFSCGTFGVTARCSVRAVRPKARPAKRYAKMNAPQPMKENRGAHLAVERRLENRPPSYIAEPRHLGRVPRTNDECWCATAKTI